MRRRHPSYNSPVFLGPPNLALSDDHFGPRGTRSLHSTSWFHPREPSPRVHIRIVECLDVADMLDRPCSELAEASRPRRRAHLADRRDTRRHGVCSTGVYPKSKRDEVHA
jgi:hypothetical protein